MEIHQPLHTDNFQSYTNFQEMKCSILIVDDESSGRTTLKILLEKHFWAHIESLIFAKSFEEAKEKIIIVKLMILFFSTST